jgi:hypothetical protein
MFSSFSAPFDLGKPVRAFGLDPANRPIFHLDAGLPTSYSGSGITWTDLRGNNDGTLTNSPTFSTDRFTFDGSNDYVDMPNGFADFTSGFTCFFVANFGSAASWERLMDFGNGDSSNNILFARSGITNNLAFQIYNGISQSVSLDITVTDGVLNNELATYAVTLDGTNAYMYRNGVQIGTAVSAVLPNNIERTNNYIGRSNWVADAYFSGEMAVAMLFDKALTADQIATNHNYFAYRYNIGSKYTIESFTTTGTTTWRPPKNVNEVEYLVVGGGGGGGTGYDNAGGGGGAGGMVRAGVVPVNRNGWYSITVGAGGAGGPDTRTNTSGSSGSNSSFTDQNSGTFDAITSLGGGYGKGSRTNSASGEAAQVGITTAPTGGDGNGGGTDGGGGGGATGAGGAGGGSPGAGGAGFISSISGSSVTYGVGGGGGYNGGPYDGAAGTANRGNGGGGGSSPSSNSAGGGAGGSGIVILKYAPIVSHVETDLIYHLDASQTDSYPTTGTAVSDLTDTLGDSTLINGPTFTQAGQASYWTFDGSNDYLISPNLETPMSGENHSTECWIYPTGNGVVVTYAGQANPLTAYHHSAIEIVSGNLEFGLWNSSGITSTGATSAISNNAWHQVVLTYDGTTCRGYLDGSLAGSVTVSWDSPHINSGSDMYMAFGVSDVTNQGDGTYFNGRFGAIRIYTGALTADEILQNYNATKGRFGL